MSQNNNINPFFIILAGPSGSGKSTLINKISNYLKNDELLDKKNTVFISVDDLIEKNPYFKKEVNNYFKKQFKSKKKDIYNEFLYPSKKTIDFFNKTYWNARKNTDCITGNNLNFKNKTKQEKNYKPCSHIISNNILIALKNKNNIVFETTGLTFPFWIFKKYPNDLINYKLIIAWSIVDICDLYDRNKFRTINNTKLFIETLTDNAPRLPDIRKKNYKRNLIDIINTYNELVKYYGNRTLSRLRLLLFDNRTKTTKNLYDSYINSDKTGYNEILKYNINNNCDKKSTLSLSKNASLSSSKKSSLSPSKSSSLSSSRKSSLSPSKSSLLSFSRKSSLSPSKSSSLSSSRKSSLSPSKSSSLSSSSKLISPLIKEYDSSSIRKYDSSLGKLESKTINNIPTLKSIHPMITRSKAKV